MNFIRLYIIIFSCRSSGNDRRRRMNVEITDSRQKFMYTPFTSFMFQYNGRVRTRSILRRSASKRGLKGCSPPRTLSVKPYSPRLNQAPNLRLSMPIIVMVRFHVGCFCHWNYTYAFTQDGAYDNSVVLGLHFLVSFHECPINIMPSAIGSI